MFFQEYYYHLELQCWVYSIVTNVYVPVHVLVIIDFQCQFLFDAAGLNVH